MDQEGIGSAILLYFLLLTAVVTSLECFLWQKNISEKQTLDDGGGGGGWVLKSSGKNHKWSFLVTVKEGGGGGRDLML